MIILLAFLLARTLPEPGPEAVVLGIAQDGGVPHAGCQQALCVEARRNPAKRRLVASLGLVDAAAGKRFLIDATPDFAEQMDRLGGLPDGILLTHAHIGHYLGLAQLGREVLAAKGVPVYCTPAMAKFLRENRPWSRLVELENIAIHEIEIDTEFALTASLHVTAIRVPHRDEEAFGRGVRVANGGREFLLPEPDSALAVTRWESPHNLVPQFSRRR